MIKSTGTLKYSPKTLGCTSPNWWLIIECDKELGKYYRKLYFLNAYGCDQLQRPAWAEHITVIRNEEPPNKNAWEKFDGIEVEYEFLSTAESDGHYVWFPVRCNFVLEIRAQLGLSRLPDIPLHLSIGHR